MVGGGAKVHFMIWNVGQPTHNLVQVLKTYRTSHTVLDKRIDIKMEHLSATDSPKQHKIDSFFESYKCLHNSLLYAT